MIKISHKCILPSFYDNFTFKINLHSNRNLPLDFDILIFKEINPHLQNLNNMEAKKHYINHGIKENRPYKYDIDKLPSDF